MKILRIQVIASPAALLLLLAVHGTARADCAQGAFYESTVTGNTVTVCLDATSRTCGPSNPMVRQDESTDEVDQLASYCPAPETDSGVDAGADAGVAETYGASCYVDECVPPGTYRYGLATPYDCSEAGCGKVSLFTEATVTSPLPTNCQRSSGDTAPTQVTTPPPWGAGSNPAITKTCPGGCGCRSAADAGILSGDAAVMLVGAAIWFGARRRARRR